MKSSCVGKYKDFKTCNTDECPKNSKSFRAEQCEKFNIKVFHGRRRYRWEPYYQEKDECSLTCKAMGYNFYAKLARTVVDGTPCRQDSNDICISGKCMKVGCDGLLGSEKQNDKCGVCGGDGSTCRVVSGIFARQQLGYGYNNITAIPKGACNINITELRQSKNYLALRTRSGKSVVNGNWAIDWSGDKKAAGTTFKYKRGPRSHHNTPGEQLLADGPINETLDLFILYNRERNPGIIYSYTTPVTSATRQQSDPTDPRLSFNEAPRYLTDDDSSNNQQYQAQRSSQRYSSQTHYTNGNTQSNSRYDTRYSRRQYNSGYYRPGQHQTPTSHQQPNVQNRYQPSSYSYQRGTGGVRYRYNNRRQPVTTDRRGQGTASQTAGHAVNDQIQLNLPEKDRTSGRGVGNTGSFSWRISGFTECSHTCGGGTQNTIIVCVQGNSLAVVTNDNCDNAIKPELQTVKCNNNPCPPGWNTTEWSECTTTCGLGQKSRNVECKQRISAALIISVTANLCAKEPRPAETQRCDSNPPCAEWKTGEWGPCSVNCGHGKKSREVKCIDSEETRVPDSQCDANRKPRNEESCDAGECRKEWYYTKWTDTCSTDCGGGQYYRKVWCGAEDGLSCDREDKPDSEKPCRSDRPCGGKWFMGPWSSCSSCSGVQTRHVICIKEVHPNYWAQVADNNCVTEDKPRQERACQSESCGAEWYLSDWGSCSASCSGGIKSRSVKCLDKDQKPSNHCKITDKPPTQESCNLTPCPTVPTDPKCKDEYSNCRIVVQARLCSYQYYHKACCKSCKVHN
ncbi:ADAMTS-like protein 4 isoform X3 [Lingula anatina]|uniref:ADAMTS-like protein 4 isoform X3 n=1 Tax=Lingula anatina TaxID=7574 RepID=A0A1S3KHQ9_LINAN|nr:ADAMTS-like protein 4 isoform X3 [Lingula anatina]|eukprot:XP_013422037.1 ADAMTS-like protein 4 isoform X3 [Lingula anatina]